MLSGHVCSVARRVVWPGVFCSQACSVASRVLWPGVFCGQACYVARRVLWQGSSASDFSTFGPSTSGGWAVYVVQGFMTRFTVCMVSCHLLLIRVKSTPAVVAASNPQNPEIPSNPEMQNIPVCEMIPAC